MYIFVYYKGNSTMAVPNFNYFTFTFHSTGIVQINS